MMNFWKKPLPVTPVVEKTEPPFTALDLDKAYAEKYKPKAKSYSGHLTNTLSPVTLTRYEMIVRITVTENGHVFSEVQSFWDLEFRYHGLQGTDHLEDLQYTISQQYLQKYESELLKVDRTYLRRPWVQYSVQKREVVIGSHEVPSTIVLNYNGERRTVTKIADEVFEINGNGELIDTEGVVMTVVDWWTERKLGAQVPLGKYSSDIFYVRDPQTLAKQLTEALNNMKHHTQYSTKSEYEFTLKSWSGTEENE
jgi:hypothetical protein